MAQSQQTHPAVAALLAAMHANVAQHSLPAGTSADGHIASVVAAHLTHAMAIAKDPELRAHLSAALHSLNKHSATLSKERAGMMQGKMPARQMAAGHQIGDS